MFQKIVLSLVVLSSAAALAGELTVTPKFGLAGGSDTFTLNKRPDGASTTESRAMTLSVGSDGVRLQNVLYNSPATAMPVGEKGTVASAIAANTDGWAKMESLGISYTITPGVEFSFSASPIIDAGTDFLTLVEVQYCCGTTPCTHASTWTYYMDQHYEGQPLDGAGTGCGPGETRYFRGVRALNGIAYNERSDVFAF